MFIRPDPAPRLLPMSFAFVVAVLAAYLIGSLDFAVVVARARGVDIYDVGSGNPGTSNVLRTMGKGAAAMTLLGDVLKGVVAAGMGFWVSGEMWGAAAAGFFAVLGHCYPVFHHFKGGKGVATFAGMLLWIVPRAALVLIVIWIILVATTRVASIGSLTVILLTIPAALLEGIETTAILWLAASVVVVAFRHKGNISRLLGQGERKVTS